MEFGARLDLLQNSKNVRKLEGLRPHLASLASRVEEEVAGLGDKEEFEYRESEDSLESQMMVCVRTR